MIKNPVTPRSLGGGATAREPKEGEVTEGNLVGLCHKNHSLPFKGRVRVGMAFNPAAKPTPIPTFPLRGKECFRLSDTVQLGSPRCAIKKFHPARSAR
jgi:hypothetical protein